MINGAVDGDIMRDYLQAHEGRGICEAIAGTLLPYLLDTSLMKAC